MSNGQTQAMTNGRISWQTWVQFFLGIVIVAGMAWHNETVKRITSLENNHSILAERVGFQGNTLSKVEGALFKLNETVIRHETKLDK